MNLHIYVAFQSLFNQHLFYDQSLCLLTVNSPRTMLSSRAFRHSTILPFGTIYLQSADTWRYTFLG